MRRFLVDFAIPANSTIRWDSHLNTAALATAHVDLARSSTVIAYMRTAVRLLVGSYARILLATARGLA